MASTKRFDLTADKWVKWKSISLHANTKACKPWAQLITDTHEDYGVDGEWLDKNYIDDQCHFDVSGLGSGDLIKVSGASHNNKKHAYYRVLSVNGELEVERIQEADVIEILESDDDDRELRAEVRDRIDELDRDELENVLAIIEGDE